MTSSIIFAGQEDSDFLPFGGSFALNSGPLRVDTTAQPFRSAYARYALNPCYQAQANAVGFSTPTLGNISNFWFTARYFGQGIGGIGNTAGGHAFQVLDANNVVRLRMRNLNSTGSVPAGPNGPYRIEKVNAAGSATQLGSLDTSGGFTCSPAVPDKLDVFVNYAVAGQLTIYINGNKVFDYSGDITTDSTTTVSYIRFLMAQWNSFGSGPYYNSWSEIIVATRDTRNMSLATQAGSALGNTDSFTGGAVANVNGNLAKDTSPDYSVSATQVQEYTVTPAIPSGNFGVISLVQHGRVSAGSSGPTKIDFLVRTGGTDYPSSDLTPAAAYTLLSYHWDTNPATAAVWATTDFPASSSSFNFGYKSVA